MQKNDWIGRSLRRKEDRSLLTGQGEFCDDLTLPHLTHAAILRSPHPHARILSIETSEAEAHPQVHAVLTGAEIAEMSSPFPTGMPLRLEYYCAAVDKVRFVGEPVAVVVADDRYVAEDALELIDVEYEPLPVVTDATEAMDDAAPLLHEDAGTNVANHRLLNYGDVDGAFAEADIVVRDSFRFHKYSSTPIETCVAMAKHDPATGVMTIWSNFHGPYSLHSFVAKGLGIPENKLRLVAPSDIGGSFGIKIAITTYLTLIGIAARASRRPVKWVEDRHEHLMALSSGAERTAHYEMAARADGTILGVKSRYIDNNGAYVRAPEPANLYRTTGNTPGPYRIRNIRIDANAVMTNKSPTGPNRGYGCQQLYYCLEGMVDLLADELGMDPSEIRSKNLIRPEQFPYRTATGGLYDSGDYPEGLRRTLEMAAYGELREEQERARSEGRLVGIGLALGVEPCVSNMGYLNISFPPEARAKPRFHTKSGAGETATVKVDPMGKVTAVASSAPSGQGHEILIAQVVGAVLGVDPDGVHVVNEMDTFTRPWTISSGNYSSRFASAGLSAFALAAEKLKEKMLRVAAHDLGVAPERLELREGRVNVREDAGRSVSFRKLAGLAHWNPNSLPDDMEPGLYVSNLFNYEPAGVIDEQDRVNSSTTYGFIAELALVEIDRETGELEILKYVSVHDCGVIINPQRVEGQIHGSVMHGLGGALYENLAYDESGQCLATTFREYICPTAAETPEVEIDHVTTPSPFSVLGTKGIGEGSSMTAPALMANAVNDALAPLGVRIRDLPLTPSRIWHAMTEEAPPAPPERAELDHVARSSRPPAPRRHVTPARRDPPTRGSHRTTTGDAES